ncbi:MAG: cation:proton antiporter [Chloroflexota bacterium]|nr:cation:proton antiporter [Chloroflexota bacterium]
MELERFGELAVIGVLAVATAIGLHRFGLPSTVGFLVTGAIAGPHGLRLVGDPEHIEQIAELGVILLLFAVGLEFSLTRLRYIWKAVAFGGSLQVGVTTLATLAILVIAGDSVARGLVFGLVVALSSTVVVLRVLTVRGELDAPHGRFIVGALIFQDLLVIPLTLLVPALAGGEGAGAALEIAWELIRAALAVVALLVVARFLIPRVFRAVDATRTREVFLLTVISIALGSAWLMSQLGLSVALGAFLAGMLLADTDYGHRATSDIIPLRDAFTSFFFISLGMIFDWRVFADTPLLAVLIVLGLVFGKALVASLAALAMRNPASVAWRSGISLAQFGEFGYVVLLIGAGVGLVTDAELRLVVTTGVVSIVVSRILMHWTGGLHAGETLLRPLERLLRARGMDEPTAQDAQVSDHVVIAGYGVAGQLLARTLAQAEVPYVVLEVDADRVREGQREHAHVYYGDVTSHEALEHARLGHARVLVMLVNDRVAMRRGIRLARADCPDVLILARTRYLSDRDDLVALGADHVVCEEVEGGTEMTARVLKSLGLATPDIYDEINSALGSDSDEFLAGAMDDWTDPAEQKP